MEGMCVNEGQLSVFESALAPEFESAAQSSPLDGWPGADPGYSDFMGEITETGNQIMEAAYAYAQDILAQQEEYEEGEEFDEETGEFLDN